MYKEISLITKSFSVKLKQDVIFMDLELCPMKYKKNQPKYLTRCILKFRSKYFSVKLNKNFGFRFLTLRP